VTVSRIVRLRDASGNVISSDPWVNFLYLLMRDHITAGVVEKLIQEAVTKPGMDCAYTNGWLAKYAENLVERVKECGTERRLSDDTNREE